MDLASADVELLQVPEWVAAQWLQFEDGAVVGEIGPDGRVTVASPPDTDGGASSSKAQSSSAPSSKPDRPMTFEAVVVRDLQNTYAIDVTSDAPRKTVERITRINALRPLDNDTAYQSLLQHRAKAEPKKAKVLEEKPAQRVLVTQALAADEKLAVKVRGVDGEKKRRKKG